METQSQTDQQLKLLCVLAHPDDESLGIGGTLAKYTAEGIETYLLTATRGQIGWFGDPDMYPGPEKLGQIRETELRAAAGVLGLREVTLLDYQDGQLDQAAPGEIIATIATHIRRIRPQVVITFGPDGSYGHPDHIAICQFTTAATLVAADASDQEAVGPAHRVSKLYYMVATAEQHAAYQAAFGELVMHVDGAERRVHTWPNWSVTTQLDTVRHWEQVWSAIACHRTQLPGYQALQALPEEHHQNLWGTQNFYRALSTINGGRQVERDLFAGLRKTG